MFIYFLYSQGPLKLTCANFPNAATSLSLSHFFKARALKEIGEFEDAVKTLETAEMISKEHTAVIQKYKTEVIMAQKEAFLNQK